MSFIGPPSLQQCNKCWWTIDKGFHTLHTVGDVSRDSKILMSVVDRTSRLSSALRGSSKPYVDQTEYTQYDPVSKDSSGNFLTLRALDTLVSKAGWLISTIPTEAQVVHAELLMDIDELKFSRLLRLIIKQQRLQTAFLMCLEVDQTSRTTKSYRTIIVTDDEADTRYKTETKVVMGKPFIQLDTRYNYIMLDGNDVACAYFEHPDMVKLANSVVSQHHDPTVQEMRAMSADMHDDFERLMQSVEDKSVNVRLSL